MMIEHTYIKRRYQFGKQCLFETKHDVAEEHIWPDPSAMQNYVTRPACDRHVQSCTQIAAHEAQTLTAPEKNTGVLHTEGGWPKEINHRDNEAVLRYCRRVEKDDSWVLSLRNLIPPMEHCVRQNNAVNIYESFFEDMIATPLVQQYDIRVRNSYEDPQDIVRPIKSLSWSPNSSNRLAAAYSFAEFEKHPSDVNPSSYVWDIENPNKAMTALKGASPLLAVEFNPHDPSLLISGLMSGQVCSWDIRTGDEPVQISAPFSSHGYPAVQALWISSKTNTEFFSASIDGTVKWWDIRFMRKPTNNLVMDLDNPSRMDRFKAVGVTAIQFEPTISSRFLAGLENGVVVNVNKRGNKPEEKLGMKFDCHAGPVIAIDRNPGMPKNFLTIGDCYAKVWSDDTKEGCLLSTGDKHVDLSGGCWSRSRGSIFFTINRQGLLKAYDILTGLTKPLTSIHICASTLTAISAHEYGELLAVGNCNGSVYLLECMDGLTMFSKEDKARLSSHFERCSRFQKTVDNRLKEIRLLRDSYTDELPERRRKSRSKSRRKTGSKDRKAKSLTAEKEKSGSLRKTKRLKSRARATVSGEPELAVAEEYYFRTIEAESAKIEELDPADVAAAKELLQERIVTRPTEEKEESEKEEPKSERKPAKIRRFRSRIRRKRAVEGADETMTETDSLGQDVDFDSLRRKGTKRPRILKSCPMEVCKPEICCKDVVEKMKSQKQPAEDPEDVDIAPKVVRPFRVKNKWYRELSEYANETPERPLAFKRKMLLLKEIPPNVLREVLAKAKSEIRAWQERVLAGKLSFRTVEKKIEDSLRAIEPAEEPSKQEEPVRKVSLQKEAPRVVDVKKRIAREVTRRRKKKTKLTPEEIEEEELEKRREKWKQLKQKVKEFEKGQVKGTYPRISAAMGRRSSEDVKNFETK